MQAPETLYWGLAATLAKHGYVVLTYDVQGQGRSDTFGDGPDQQEGVPAQAGQPFYDGTEDALNFFFSNPKNPYVPQKSCGNANGGVGTSHAGKQKRRVNEGFDAPYNPFWKMLDRSRVGIAGHSLGAAAVSYIGQIDPRVDATVAWDNLSAPSSHPACPSGSSPRPDNPPITKPAMGMSADYFLVPQPVHVRPGPAGQEPGLPRLQAGGRRLDGVDHPRRHPLRVLVPARQHGGVPVRHRHAARHGHGRLVLDRLVRPLRQVPGRRDAASRARTAAC